MIAPSSTRKLFFDTDSVVFRLPLPIVGASLVAFAALWFSESRFVLLPLLACALVVSQVANARFYRTSR
ncbi:MAG TPA: hypothetical protein VM821_01075, partial [Abditibacteriaceae bacterium]|nr:hypothetical protein [Abditibacteriaceae bacterium]